MDFLHKIDKEELREVFRSPFDPEIWKTLLIQVFGANKLYEQPKPRELDNGDNAKVQGYDLGEIITPDKYTIGLFQFEIKSGHKIPMNRVGLRGLVEKEIKYFYDAALVVYYNDSQWRVSFICDLRNEKTAPKRFTYVFGDSDQFYRTPIRQFELIKTKGASKEIIHEAFSVEALNKEFYGFIAKRFYQLVGATTGTGKNKTEHERIMRLPDKQDNLIYQEFAVRLIGRTVFCWFLKEKKSGDGVPLLPAELLSSKSLQTNNDYYHTVLERIFFQTLNTPMQDRVKGLPKGCELIPFLNGGLFDYRPHDFYAPEDDGLSKYRNDLMIPDEWFKLLFEELEQYNFTIDENSPDDTVVSVDPEMLGRIFENLLAEIDPDSGETARKATGSFYTPREIVDYMATESLVYYLNRKTGIGIEAISPLFKSPEKAEYTQEQREKLLIALDELKILDPACGSGAFPMGVLAKITGTLQILDKDALWWKKRQIERIDNATVRQAMQEKLDTATVEYARKIGIIQNTLYGVDIQPIAAEISKLRCFLTLIVDENVDDSKPNRGVDPLPNLEFKFITADSLLKLPPANIFGDGATEDIERLRQLRINYLQSFGVAKVRIKEEFRAVQQKIYNDQVGNSMLNPNSREYKISCWDPFGNEKSDWFDPEWMFGVAGGFDIVIGNPPFISHDRIPNSYVLKGIYPTLWTAFSDMYCYFFGMGVNVLATNGVLAYITSNSYLKAEYGKSLRNLLGKNTLRNLINTESSQIFSSAIVNSVITIVSKGDTEKDGSTIVTNRSWNIGSLEEYIEDNSFALPVSRFSHGYWILENAQILSILDKINTIGKSLEYLGAKIRLGIATGANDAFLLSEEQRNKFVTKDSRNDKIIKPILRGRNIGRYSYTQPTEYVILSKNGVNLPDDYPDLANHLDSFGSSFKNRGAKGRFWWNLRACDFYDDFPKEKIIWIELTDRGRFALCKEEIYLINSAYFMLPPKGYDSNFLLGLLNSKLVEFFVYKNATTSGMGTIRWINSIVSTIPIPDVDAVRQNPIIILVNYIAFLHKLADDSQINEFVPNSHLVGLFEEVIDALVYELYFEADFKAANIAFQQFVERDFRDIDGKSKNEAIEIVHSAYQKLREPDSEIRNNLKLMDIKLSELIMPIKNTK